MKRNKRPGFSLFRAVIPIAIVFALSACRSGAAEPETGAAADAEETSSILPAVETASHFAPMEENTPVPVPQETQVQQKIPDVIRLRSEEHPELDFGLSEHDGEPVIRDFALTDEGTLLLLQLSENVYEYAPDGTLCGIYDLRLKENGLTAYRIAAGADGRILLLDGHSNAVITADRVGVRNVSQVTFTDVGLFSSFACDAQGRCVVSYLDADYGGRCAILALDGPEATVLHAWTGYGIDETYSYLTSAIPEAGKNFSRNALLTLYRDGEAEQTYLLTTERSDRLLFAVEVTAMSGRTVYAYLHEWIIDEQAEPAKQATYSQSFAALDLDPMTVSLSDTTEHIENPKYYGRDCYVMNRTADGLKIRRVDPSADSFYPTDVYSVSIAADALPDAD